MRTRSPPCSELGRELFASKSADDNRKILDKIEVPNIEISHIMTRWAVDISNTTPF